MARLKTVNQIINQAAIEVGLLPVTDPVASTEETFVQMEGLLNGAGLELINLHDWQNLIKTFAFTTLAGDTGTYDLPEDFDHMIDQTGWDRSNTVALGGPLSAQDWTYLLGRDLVNKTIYASFRQAEGKLQLFPQPPSVGLNISFEYMSCNWLEEVGGDFVEEITDGSNICQLPAQLVTKFLKLKWLSAKGFDTTNAALEFDTLLDSRTGKDTGAAILSAGQNGRQFPYITPYGNVGDTGFGTP